MFVGMLLGTSVKQILDGVHRTGSLVQGNLGLNTVNDLIDHVIRKIHTQYLLHYLYRLIHELGFQRLVLSNLLHNCCNLLFNIHFVTLSFSFVRIFYDEQLFTSILTYFTDFDKQIILNGLKKKGFGVSGACGQLAYKAKKN